jgi:hypothetical protein
MNDWAVYWVEEIKSLRIVSTRSSERITDNGSNVKLTTDSDLNQWMSSVVDTAHMTLSTGVHSESKFNL